MSLKKLAAYSRFAGPHAARHHWTVRAHREITGGRRNRLFAYEAYLAILSEGTVPL